MIKSFLKRKYYNLLDSLTELLKTPRIKAYDRRLPEIEDRVFKKERIKVVFFVINIGMWKNDDLFKLFLDSERFDPYIVSFIYKHDSLDYKEYVQNEMRDYFKSKGFPFIKGYDVSSGKYFNLKAFKPDILLYAQPYNVEREEYKVMDYFHDCLFAYIPYCIAINDLPSLRNLFYKNICWKMFYPTRQSKEHEAHYLTTRRDNIVVSGYTSADYLTGMRKYSEEDWKPQNGSMKRIIWAPHHSILKNDLLDYSNFLEIADGMVGLAQKYSDRIQFAFKPHPRLMRKLYELEEWGKTRTDNYFDKWRTMPNTSFVDGEYYDLFLSSDAMIHDCCSFMIEYLFTRKPIMFVTGEKEKLMETMNMDARKSMELHYTGATLQDIEQFINEVILEGKDPMRPRREDYYERELKTPGTGKVSQNIFDTFISAIR